METDVYCTWNSLNVNIDLLEAADHGDEAFRTDENICKVLKFFDKYIMEVKNKTYGAFTEIPLVK